MTTTSPHLSVSKGSYLPNLALHCVAEQEAKKAQEMKIGANHLRAYIVIFCACCIPSQH
jgi:hypothetical protein